MLRTQVCQKSEHVSIQSQCRAQILMITLDKHTFALNGKFGEIYGSLSLVME